MKKNELILSVRDLNIKFNLRGKILHAIRGIDLDVYHGEVLAIVGESGTGSDSVNSPESPFSWCDSVELASSRPCGSRSRGGL